MSSYSGHSRIPPRRGGPPLPRSDIAATGRSGIVGSSQWKHPPFIRGACPNRPREDITQGSMNQRLCTIQWWTSSWRDGPAKPRSTIARKRIGHSPPIPKNVFRPPRSSIASDGSTLLYWKSRWKSMSSRLGAGKHYIQSVKDGSNSRSSFIDRGSTGPFPNVDDTG